MADVSGIGNRLMKGPGFFVSDPNRRFFCPIQNCGHSQSRPDNVQRHFVDHPAGAVRYGNMVVQETLNGQVTYISAAEYVNRIWTNVNDGPALFAVPTELWLTEEEALAASGQDAANEEEVDGDLQVLFSMAKMATTYAKRLVSNRGYSTQEVTDVFNRGVEAANNEEASEEE